MSRSWAPFFLSLLSCSFAFAQCSGNEPIVTTIPVVRGQGSPSACVGKAVTVTGVVTASIGGLNGFFLQDTVGDGDPSTSDAIFVLTGSPDNLPDPGSVAQVTGKILEVTRDGQPGSVTELDIKGGSVQLTGVAPLPDPVVLDPGLDQPSAYLQANEAMLVTYPASTVVTPADAAGTYFSLRDDRLPVGGRVTDASLGTGQPILVDTGGGAVVRNVNELDTVPGLTAVLHFDYGAFRLQPLAAYDSQSDGLTTHAAPVDQPFLSVAALDCLRLAADVPAADRETRLTKLALAVQNQLGSPDVVAVEGLGDIGSITQLAARSSKSVKYVGLFLKGCNPDGTNVGLLFNGDRLDPLVASEFQIEAPDLNKASCTLPTGQPFTHPLFENPPLRLDVLVDSQSLVTLIINDWRSPTADPAQQAIEGVKALQTLLDKIDNPNIVILGNFNQPEGSDALTGFEQSSNFVNLSGSVDPAVRYTYTHKGRSQAVDHIFVSPALFYSVKSSGFAHFNADFSVVPNRQDATTAVRVADHDSPFLHLLPF